MPDDIQSPRAHKEGKGSAMLCDIQGKVGKGLAMPDDIQAKVCKG